MLLKMSKDGESRLLNITLSFGKQCVHSCAEIFITEAYVLRDAVQRKIAQR